MKETLIESYRYGGLVGLNLRYLVGDDEVGPTESEAFKRFKLDMTAVKWWSIGLIFWEQAFGKD